MAEDEHFIDITSEPSTSSGVRRTSRPTQRRFLDSRTNNFQDDLCNLVYETIDDELVEDIDDSDQDPDYVEQSDHDSDSEQSENECEIEHEKIKSTEADSSGKTDSVIRTTSNLSRAIKRKMPMEPSNETKIKKFRPYSDILQVQSTQDKTRLSPSTPIVLPELNENFDSQETSQAQQIVSDTSSANTNTLDIAAEIAVVNEVTPTTDSEETVTPLSNTRDGQFYYGRRTKEMIKRKIPPFRWRKNAANQAVRTRADNITETEDESVKSWSQP